MFYRELGKETRLSNEASQLSLEDIPGLWVVGWEWGTGGNKAKAQFQIEIQAAQLSLEKTVKTTSKIGQNYEQGGQKENYRNFNVSWEALS